MYWFGIPDMILLFEKTLNYTFVIENKIILVLKQSSVSTIKERLKHKIIVPPEGGGRIFIIPINIRKVFCTEPICKKTEKTLKGECPLKRGPRYQNIKQHLPQQTLFNLHSFFYDQPVFGL